MNAIVLVDNNNGIGKDGHLLYHIPRDMKNFKLLTMNRCVIMGRKTLESLPGGKPLKNRINVVLTRDKNYENNSVLVMHSKDEVLEYIRKNNLDQDTYIIGGSDIYNLFINDCKFAYITKIYTESDADRFFPDIRNNPNWIMVDASSIYYTVGDEIDDKPFRFFKYKNTKVSE